MAICKDSQRLRDFYLAMFFELLTIWLGWAMTAWMVEVGNVGEVEVET